MRRIVNLSTEPTRYAAGALVGDRLAVAHGTRVTVATLGHDAVTDVVTATLPIEIGAVAFAPSARHLAVTDGRRQRVIWWDVERARVIGAVDAVSDRQAIVSAFARVDDQDVGLVCRARGRLEIIELATGRCVAELDCATFRFWRMVPLRGGEKVVIVGCFHSEGADSLAVVDPAMSSADVREHLRSKAGIVDRAYDLCVGPCGEDALVAFRNPEGDETEEAADAHGWDDVWGRRCAYVRGLDGALVAAVDLVLPLPSFAPAAAGRRTLAVAGRERIHVVDRASGVTAAVAARWLGAAADGTRVLVDADGALAVLEL